MPLARILLSAGLLPVAAAPPSTSSADVPIEARSADDDFERIRHSLFEHPSGLTAEQVAQKARNSAPSVAIADADIEDIDASVANTVARFAPGVSLVARYARLSEAAIDFGGGGGGAAVGAANPGILTVGLCPDQVTVGCVVDPQGSPVVAVETEPLAFEIPLNNFHLQATLSLPVSDYILRLKPALVGSRAEKKAAKLRRLAEIENVDLQARVAYYEWVRIAARQMVAGETLARLNARVEDARLAVSGGLMTPADLARLEGRVASVEDSISQLASFRRQSETGLAILMGIDPEAFRIGEDVLAPQAADPKLANAEQLVDHALSKRSSIVALGHTRVALREAKKAARTLFWPRLDGSADFTYANPNQRFFPATQDWNYSWSVGVSLSWQLGQALNGRAESKRMDAAISKLKANRSALLRAVRSEVHRAWEALQRARAHITAQRKVVASVLPAYEQTAELFRGGEATTTDVLDAEGELLDASLELVSAHIDLRVATTQLEHAAGLVQLAGSDGDEISGGPQAASGSPSQ